MEPLTFTPQPTLSHELRALINQRNILTAKSKSKVLESLDKEIEENRTKYQFDLRTRVIEEIFTSEVSYLHQLELIIKFFKKPLDSSDLMTSSTRRSLFGNIESIYQVNGQLVNQLRIEENNVGAAFLYLAPFFKLYSMYAYDYKKGLSLLEESPKQNSRLSLWIKNQETRPEVCTKLSALLIAPIQRLPRYRLLLRQLLSLTPITHPHYSILIEAVREVEKATEHVDSLVYEQEKNSRLVTLQQCFVRSKPQIVSPYKKLLKEGVIMKMSGNGQKAQKRYFILLTDSILYCKMLYKDHDKPPVVPWSLQCCCVLPISKCKVESVLGQGVFNLTCRSEVYILFCESRDDGLEWVAEIRSAILQHQENMRTLHKKSSSRHPLHLTRKRKFFKENESSKDNISSAKKVKTDHLNSEDQSGRASYMKSIKTLFQTFGESVRQYFYPASANR